MSNFDDLKVDISDMSVEEATQVAKERLNRDFERAFRAKYGMSTDAIEAGVFDRQILAFIEARDRKLEELRRGWICARYSRLH